MTPIFFLIPVCSILALVFAFIFYRRMKRADEGTPTMKEIASHVRKGPGLFKQQYKVAYRICNSRSIFAILYGFGVKSLGTVCISDRRFFSGLAGFIGETATLLPHALRMLAELAQLDSRHFVLER